MRLTFTGFKDHGPKELGLLRRDFLPGQIEVDGDSGDLVIGMSAHVETHLQGDYRMRLQLTKNEIAALARIAFGKTPFAEVLDCLCTETIGQRVRASAKARRENNGASD